MIKLKTNVIKDLMTKINKGIEGERTVRVSELLELTFINNKLTVAVTNTQFYLTIEINNEIQSDEVLHFTLDADTFIKLVLKTSTEYITLSQEEGNLIFTGNGRYTFPLELDENGEVKVLPKINFNAQKSFEFSGDELYSIYSFGSYELVNDVPVDPVQKFYFVDNHGAVTYTESPYLNNFNINTEFKVLINSRLAQLFTLFRNNKVQISLETEPAGNIYQNKINFKCDNINLTSYLPDNSIVEKYPVNECRALQNNPYPGKVVINRLALSEALDRLNIFSIKEGNVVYKKAGKLEFTSEGLKIISILDKNEEFLKYEDKIQFSPYTCYMNLSQLQRHAKANNEVNVEVNYGNDLCIMISKDNYSQIIVEMENPGIDE